MGAAAQQTTGDIQGRITSPGGQPLADVQVSVLGPSLQGDRRTLSDAHGGFRLLALPPGTFTVQLTRLGYRPLVIEQVAVQLGHTTALGEVTLPEQVTELPPLVVTADRPAIDPLTSSLGTNVSATAIEQLPLGRDYRSIITLFPQANESYLGDGVNVAGGTGLENAYFVDGVNVTEPYRGDGGIDLPLNFVDHVQLRQRGHAVRWGRATPIDLRILHRERPRLERRARAGGPGKGGLRPLRCRREPRRPDPAKSSLVLSGLRRRGGAATRADPGQRGRVGSRRHPQVRRQAQLAREPRHRS